MASRTRWLGLIALATAMLAFAGSAQARQKDDGDVIVCQTLASCLADIPQPGGDGDLSGTDASSLGSVVSGDDPDTSDSSPPSSGPSSPQVVTTPAPTAPAVVTTKPATAVKPPYCIDHPEFGQGPLPRGWVRNPRDGSCSYDVCLNRLGVQSSPPDGMYQDDDGNCQPKRGPDAEGTCDPHGAYLLVLKAEVDGTLAKGYVMAIMVDGVGLVCLISDVTAFHADPTDYVFSGTWVEGGDTHFPLYSCQTPFGGETVPFYKFYVRKGTTVTPTAKEEPGCKPGPPKATPQTELAVRMHGLKWGGHYYRSPQIFARVLAREGSGWRGWKQNHPDLARGLMAHAAAYKRPKK